jgi:hypothetical protein
VDGFREFLEEKGMLSLWDADGDYRVKTTCSARTYLQVSFE